MLQLNPYLVSQRKTSPSRLRRRKRREMCKKTVEKLDKSTNTEEINVETVIENANTPILNYPNLSRVLTNSLCEHEELQHRNPGATMQIESQDLYLESSLDEGSDLFKHKDTRPMIYSEVHESQISLSSADSRKYNHRDKELYDYLEEQKRQKDLEIQKLTGKLTLGFKPMKTKKPF